MNNLWLLIAVGAAIVLIVIALVRLANMQREQKRMLSRLRQATEQQEKTLNTLTRMLSDRMGDLAQGQDRLRGTLDTRMESIERGNDLKLEQMRQTVDEKLTARLNVVNRQLADVHQGLGQVQEMAGEFGDLKKILGGVKTRGIWGEVQLKSLLDEILSPAQYLENAAIPEGSSTRVEFAVRLPAQDGEALLPIDSKFPQEDYLRLADAQQEGDPKKIDACAQKLERAILEQGRMISEKYIRPPQTADFAVMFLPVESLYAEASRRSGLCEQLQTKYRVLVAGPNTLSALLSSLRMGFRTVTLEKRSGEVLSLLQEVQDEFARYADAVAAVRRRMDQTYDALDVVDQRARKLSRRLREIAEESE